jgi:hypothetical protein
MMEGHIKGAKARRKSTCVPAMGKGHKGARNWIKGAIKHKGAFAAYASHAHLPMSKAIAKGAHSHNPVTRRRAVLARTLRSMHHHH